jgi:hypothetical protein
VLCIDDLSKATAANDRDPSKCSTCLLWRAKDQIELDVDSIRGKHAT